MADAPLFFLPETTPETVEAKYADMADRCHCAVPDRKKRIYSISFTEERRSDEEWTATVGKYLRGVRYSITRSGGAHVERQLVVRDGATVQAIFSGPQFVVVTDCRIGLRIRSDWGNPFDVDKPTSITYFSAAHAPPKEFTE